MKKTRGNLLFIYYAIVSVIFITNIGYTQFNPYDDNIMPTQATINTESDEMLNYTNNIPKQSVHIEEEYHFGVWVNYQQQFGAIGDKFITIGGPSFGFNLGKYFFLGGGVYSSFGSMNFNGKNDSSLVYGGGIVGVRWNPKSPVVFRTQVLIGAIAFDTLSAENPGLLENRTTSLIVVPEIALDIRLIDYLFLSLSANYRYVENLPNAWAQMQGLGALSGAVSLGLSF